MKTFVFRPEILCTTSCCCFRSWVNSGTTCKRHRWKRVECIVQNQRDQGTVGAVGFSQVTLPREISHSVLGSFSPRTGLHNLVLPHPSGPAPCLRCPLGRACSVLSARGALGHSTRWSRSLQNSGHPIQWPNPRDFQLTPMGFAMCKPQQNLGIPAACILPTAGMN